MTQPTEIPAPGLQRYLDAQAPVYDEVLRELRQGQKQTHWMWFIFPQLTSLGRSATARKFGISDLDQACDYLRHPMLSARLRECFELVLTHQSSTPQEMFGSVDAVKLRSCATLFLQASGGDPLCQAVLDTFYGGEQDPSTLKSLCR